VFPLYTACQNGNYDVAKYLIEELHLPVDGAEVKFSFFLVFDKRGISKKKKKNNLL